MFGNEFNTDNWDFDLDFEFKNVIIMILISLKEHANSQPINIHASREYGKQFNWSSIIRDAWDWALQG